MILKSDSRRFPPFKALRAFEATARHKSLSKASIELNVSRSAISQQVKLLEGFLDAKLFEKRGVKLVMTEQASAYFPVISNVLGCLHHGTNDLFGKQPKHILNIRIAQSYCHTWLLPRLADFHRNHPDIHLKFKTTTTTYPNISPDINSGLDIEIINGHGDWKDLTIKKLTHDERWLVVASPSFMKHHDFSLSLEHIAQYAKIETSGYTEGWQQWFHTQRLGMRFSTAIFMFDSTQLSIDAAIQGNGMLLAKSILVQDAVQQGDLVVVHPHQLQSKSNHYLVINPNSKAQYKVKAFERWLLSIVEP